MDRRSLEKMSLGGQTFLFRWTPWIHASRRLKNAEGDRLTTHSYSTVESINRSIKNWNWAMDLLGLVRVKVVRGLNLAFRDSRGSDSYVVVLMGAQKLKTSVKKNNCNPEWNEELTLSIKEPLEPVKFEVYDKDTFSKDDKMGDAELDIKPLVDSVRLDLLQRFPSGTVINTVAPSTQNCIAAESNIVWKEGKITQDVVLRLRNVESGELELQLQWISVPGSTAL